jgi:hypothetical protein
MESGTPIYVDVKHGDDGLPHSGKSGVAMSGGGLVFVVGARYAEVGVASKPLPPK